MQAGFALIELPHGETQISGEGQPDKIRNLQPCRRWVNFAEGKDHQKYSNPKRRQPEESKTVSLQIEENQTPEEVQHQLYDKKIQSLLLLRRIQRKGNSGGADAH